MGFLDCYSAVSEGLVSVFEWSVVLGLVIFMFVFILVVDILWFKGGFKGSVESVYLEFIWTLLPLMVLVFLAYPSMVLMYMFNPETGASTGCSVMGWQWYWSYSMSGFSFESYPSGAYRLLDVDNRLVLPKGGWVKLFISSGDVIHSWALPSFGVKMDAIPGRVNVLDMFCAMAGVFYGQCSELCGVGHSFMPICVEVI
uniref:Cytochrome c oxidase subunit 2 n=1 Tax=Paratenuisentis ambiguus TaxID=185730 RepID=K0JA74_PARAB|nr:cytochrome c oxidase subunit II [Paratenuisentis ambiguus]CCA94487.2 cytochrome oxidase subunit 2 [Paratenuisentis ambiguus]